jgi:membrane protease YdiL (CAAX protease family)
MEGVTANEDIAILAERVSTPTPHPSSIDRLVAGWGIWGSAKSRWWTPLLVAAVSLAAFMVVSTVAAVVALFVAHGEFSPDVFLQPNPMKVVSESRLGLFLLVVIPQFALVIPCVVAAILSPVPFRERLGLVRGNWPVWTWLPAAAATPLVGMVSGLVVGLFLDESEALKEMSTIFRDHGQSGFLLPLAMMIGATPAICEELLFRGYIQTRLAQSLGPILGVGIASFLFAAFHLDFVHVVAVLPLGLYLGWVSWQSGSLFPAMLGHFVNNVISVVALVFAPEESPDTLALPAVAFTLGIFALGLMGVAVVSVVAIVYRRTDPVPLPAGDTQLT